MADFDVVAADDLGSAGCIISTGRVCRAHIPASNVVSNASRVKILFDHISGNDWVISSVWIGHESADAYFFDGTQVQLLFGGNAGVTISGETWSDEVDYYIDETKDLLISFAITSGNVACDAGGTGQSVRYITGGDTEAATIDIGAGTSANYIFGYKQVVGTASISPPAAIPKYPIFCGMKGLANGGSSYTRRFVISASLLKVPATKIRILWMFNTVNYTIPEVWIGLKARSGDASDMDPSTMVQVKMAGANRHVITSATTFSDETDFIIDGTRDVVVSVFISSAAYYSGARPPGVAEYYKQTVNEAGTADVTGYTTGTTNLLGFRGIWSNMPGNTIFPVIHELTPNIATAGNSTREWRVKTLAVMLNFPATKIRIKFQRNSNTNWGLSSAWVGHRGTGLWDFDGTQVQLKFRGDNGCNFSAPEWSDWVDYTIDPTKDLIVSFACNTDSLSYGIVTDNVSSYYRTGSDAEAAATTYTTGTANASPWGFNGIEGITDVKTPTEKIHFNVNPCCQQNDFNNSDMTDVTGWTAGTALTGGSYYCSAFIIKNQVHLIGGTVASVWSAPIDGLGVIGTWVTKTSLPAVRSGACLVVTSTRVYVLGVSTTGYYCKIMSDGSLSGVWETCTSPSAATHARSIITNNRVYFIAGNGDENVFWALIDENGIIGTWTQDTDLPTTTKGYCGIAKIKDKVYLFGGFSGSAVATVHVATIDSSGVLSSFTEDTSATLPAARHSPGVLVTKDRVFLFGGSTTAATNSCISAPINSDGTLGSWATGTTLLEANCYFPVVVTSSRIYTLGGYGGQTLVRYAPFRGGFNDYSIFTTKDGIDEWSENYKYTLSLDVPSTDLLDFPLMFRISAATGKTNVDIVNIFTTLGLFYKRISASIGGVQCFIEVNEWDFVNKEAIIFIRVPKILSTQNTIIVLLCDKDHYDNDNYVGWTGTTPAQAVWDAQTLRHYNLTDEPTRTLKNSTATTDNLTANGTMTYDDLESMDFGKGLHLDGTDDYLALTNPGTVTNFTFEAYLEPISTLTGDGVFVVANNGLVFSNGYLAMLRAGDVRRGGNTIVNNTEIFITCSYNGTNDLYYENGTPLNTSITDATWGLASEYSIGRGKSAATPEILIKSVSLSNVARSADWIDYKSKAHYDNVLTLILPFPLASLQILYEYTQYFRQNPLNILYDYSQYLTSIFNVIYKNYICGELLIKFNNASFIQKDMLIRYVCSKDISKSIALRWIYAIDTLSSLNIKYDTYAEVLKELNIRYKISAGEVENFLRFVYNNYDHNLAANELKMIWHSFVSDNTSITPNVSLVINGVNVLFNKLTVSGSKSRYTIIGEASTDFNTYSNIKLMQTVVATIGTDVFDLVVSDKYIRSLSNATSEYTLEFCSIGLKLLTPFSKPLNGDVGPGLSSTICINIAASEGVNLIWSHLDKYFGENLVYADNESKIDVIRKIVNKMGGKVTSRKDGTLEVTPRYSEPVSNWPLAIPERTFTNADFESISEYTSEKGNYNRIFISSQLSSSLSYNSTIKTEDINAYSKIVKGFVTPINSVNSVALGTSGGSWVSIESFGLVEEIIEEETEFVSGAARSQNPIYELLDVDWLQAYLGNITFSEDGNLEAPSTGSTKGCSFVNIRYTTKYYRWIVRSNNMESVQFILDVERKQ